MMSKNKVRVYMRNIAKFIEQIYFFQFDCNSTYYKYTLVLNSISCDVHIELFILYKLHEAQNLLYILLYTYLKHKLIFFRVVNDYYTF